MVAPPRAPRARGKVQKRIAARGAWERPILRPITRLPNYPISQCYDRRVSLDERDFFNNKNETRLDKLTCPRCKRVNEYQMRWVVRTRKDRIPPGADERDRALFAKLKDYMIRVDDSVTCKTCGKKFDIPSQHSLVFLDPKADEQRKAFRDQ